METGYHKAKGLRGSDAQKGINMDKRPEGPIKTMGYPCSMESPTPATKLGYKKAVPSDLDPRNKLLFGEPKARYF